MEDYMKDWMNLVLEKCNSRQEVETQIKFTKDMIAYDSNELKHWQKQLNEKGENASISWGAFFKKYKDIVEIYSGRIDYSKTLLAELEKRLTGL